MSEEVNTSACKAMIVAIGLKREGMGEGTSVAGFCMTKEMDTK